MKAMSDKVLKAYRAKCLVAKTVQPYYQYRADKWDPVCGWQEMTVGTTLKEIRERVKSEMSVMANYKYVRIVKLEETVVEWKGVKPCGS